MTINFDDFLESFDDKTLERGLQLFKRDKVIDIQMQDDGEIAGIVQGSERTPYRQTVWANDQQSNPAGGRSVRGICSCPVNRNCKHAAAVLFGLFARMEAEAGRRAVDGDDAVSAEGAILPAASQVTQSPSAEQSDDLEDWLTRLPDATDSSQPKPSKASQHLVYLLHFDERKKQVSLALEVRPQLKSGKYSTSTSRHFDLSRYLQRSEAPGYIDRQDRLILSHLLASKSFGLFGRFITLTGEFVVEILQRIIASGRTFRFPEPPESALHPLQWGEPETLELRWSPTPSGDFSLTLLVAGAHENMTVISSDPPLYLDMDAGLIGTLNSGVLPTQLTHLQRMPAVPAKQVKAFAKRLKPSLHADIPLPIQQPARDIDVPPRFVLSFGRERYRALLNSRVSRALGQRKQTLMDGGEPASPMLESERFLYVLPRFAYEDLLLDPLEDLSFQGRYQQTIWQDHQCIRIQRDLNTEEAMLEALQWVGLRPLSAAELSTTNDNMALAFTFDLLHEDKPWLDLMTKVVPDWEVEAWEMRYDDDFPFANVVVPDEDVTWFNAIQPAEDGNLMLGIGIEIDGVQHNLLPCLLRLMTEYTPASLALLPDSGALPVVVENGTKLYLPVIRVRSLVTALYELFDHLPEGAPEAAELRIRPEEMPLLDELNLESRHHESVIRLRQMIDQLKQPELASSLSLPTTFRASLRDYQMDGVRWLQLLREVGSGGILADDMGLGKTVQALAHLCIEQAAGRLGKPALLVVPTTLITNWKSEAAKFAPELRVLVIHGPDRHERFAEIEQSDLVITTYPLILRDAETLTAISYSQLILDEAQSIKNPRARVTQQLSAFKADQRICLTGTPLENHLGELWSQFNFLNPGLLRDLAHFRRHYRKPIEEQGNLLRQRALYARIAPFMLRRTKGEVATELPPKTIMVKRAVFRSKQRDLYETVRAAMDKKVRKIVAQKGLNRSQIEILDALLKLRQICCDPALLKLPAAQQLHESAKLELLMGMLPELLEEGRRVLIFSQFTTMLALIETRLQDGHIDFVKLTGATRDRATPLQRFQNEEVPVFLISLKAGGTGLNLTAADTVIHYDPWWNPAVEDQASDRAYRIGQNKPVFVYRLIVEDSVEERMLKLQEKKRALAESVYENTGQLSYGFDEGDLAELFQ